MKALFSNLGFALRMGEPLRQKCAIPAGRERNGQIMEIIKVSSKSAPHAVAGAIANVIRDKTAAEIQAVGAGATNQAIKAIAIARGYLAPSGIDIACIPGFANVEVGGEARTAIRLIVKTL